MNSKLLILLLHFALCGAGLSVIAQQRSTSSNVIKRAAVKCRPNPDPLYVRSAVFKEFADILNRSIPEYFHANPKGFYSESESGFGFFVFDLTNPSNKYVVSKDCVDFLEEHIYHVAPHHSHYSLSHIIILEEGKLRVFRSVNCPARGDQLEDAINYVSAKLAQDKNKKQIIKRIRNYRKYGDYFELDHGAFICKNGRGLRQ